MLFFFSSEVSHGCQNQAPVRAPQGACYPLAHAAIGLRLP
jgi:hypothetical protein